MLIELRYLEQRFGQGTVRRMNGCLRGKDYDEKKLFGECCKGHKVEDLWYASCASSYCTRLTFCRNDYGEEIKKKSATTAEGGEAHEAVPTHVVKP